MLGFRTPESSSGAPSYPRYKSLWRNAYLTRVYLWIAHPVFGRQDSGECALFSEHMRKYAAVGATTALRAGGNGYNLGQSCR